MLHLKIHAYCTHVKLGNIFESKSHREIQTAPEKNLNNTNILICIEIWPISKVILYYFSFLRWPTDYLKKRQGRFLRCKKIHKCAFRRHFTGINDSIISVNGLKIFWAIDGPWQNIKSVHGNSSQFPGLDSIWWRNY